jgi:hypothetical protein
MTADFLFVLSTSVMSGRLLLLFSIIIIIAITISIIRNSSLFTATRKNSPSARCVSAANRVCEDVDMFRKPTVSLKQILRWSVTLFQSIYLFNVFHVRAVYYTKTLITNKCTKRVLSSIITHSYMFRPCWVIFRENFFVIVTLRLHFTVEWECGVGCVLWLCSAGPDRGGFTPPKATQYTVNSTFSLNYKVQP